MKQRFRDAVNILCYKVENSNMSIQNVSPFPDILYILYLDYLIKECNNLREGYRTLGVVTNSKGFMHIFQFHSSWNTTCHGPQTFTFWILNPNLQYDFNGDVFTDEKLTFPPKSTKTEASRKKEGIKKWIKENT